MSLPKCTMVYDHHPEVGSEEEISQSIRNPMIGI
jgi:hypothetical protein